jgi:hypothetical protein
VHASEAIKLFAILSPVGPYFKVNINIYIYIYVFIHEIKYLIIRKYIHEYTYVYAYSHVYISINVLCLFAILSSVGAYFKVCLCIYV